MSEEEPDYPKIADELMSGTVIPFFGAAASAVYRPPDAEWEQGAPFLPFGSELAKILAQNSSYSAANAAYEAALFELADAAAKAAPGVPVDEIKTALQPVLREHFGMPTDLALIASFFSQVYRSRPILEQVLGKVFAAAPEPGALQTRLAAIESIKLYVTTNYDDLLERALAPRVPHVLVDRLEKGLAICTSSGTLEPIARTGQDLDTRLTDPNTGEPSRPILFKMHGSISRNSAQNASYVITEEDYVDYLGRDGGNYVPPYINGRMQGRSLLFIGYSLEDWNVRVILSKLLRTNRQGDLNYWAIVRGRADTERRIWKRKGLEIYPVDLLRFSDRLVAELDRRC